MEIDTAFRQRNTIKKMIMEPNQQNNVAPFLKEIASEKKQLDTYVEAIVSNIKIAILDERFRISWVNERFCRLTQYTQDDLIGKPINKLTFLCLDRKTLRTIFEMLSCGTQWCGEVKSQAKDGTFFWTKTTLMPIRKHGKIVSYLVFNSNITPTKRALEEKHSALENLVKSEARYRALIEHQADIVSLCSADGTRLFVNNSYCQFLGKTFDELVGTNINDLPLNGIPFEARNMLRTLTPENPESSEIFELKNSFGEKVWISLLLKGIFDSHGNLYEFLTIGRDVTELKNAEVQKTHHVEALEKIAFMTSHNVRGPIATILGLVELLHMDAIRQEEWNSMLSYFRKSSRDLEVYIKDLAAYVQQNQVLK